MSGTTRVMMKEMMMTFYPNSPTLKQGEAGTWESASRWGENPKCICALMDAFSGTITGVSAPKLLNYVLLPTPPTPKYFEHIPPTASDSSGQS